MFAVLKKTAMSPIIYEVLDVGTGVTDAGLAPLSSLSQLRFLHLYRTGITGAGLVHLTRMKELSTLNLDETGITDKELVHLHRLPRLRFL